jgi:hypothetical protein
MPEQTPEPALTPYERAWLRRGWRLIAGWLLVFVWFAALISISELRLAISLPILFGFAVAVVWVLDQTVRVLYDRPGDMFPSLRWPAVVLFTTFYLWLMAFSFFSHLLYTLFKNGKVHFEHKPKSELDVIPLLWWHVADLVPVADVQTTLRWDEPLGYKQSGVGVAIVVFQVLFVLPLIAAVRAWWKARKGETPDSWGRFVSGADDKPAA